MRHLAMYLQCVASTAPASDKRRLQTKELEAVRGVVAALMHELECILHEYLSFNWDRVDDIYDVNSHLLREEGLVCTWRSQPALNVCLSVKPLLYEVRISVPGCQRL